MLWGNRAHARALGRTEIVLVLAAILAIALWAASALHRADLETRVLGTTLWSGSVSFPSGYTVVAGQTVDLNPLANTTVELGGNLIVQGTLRSFPAPGVT